jgi:PhnB protein
MPEQQAREERLNLAIDALLAGSAAATGEPEVDSLIRIAAELRAMPSEDFQSRLKSELQRRAAMPAAAVPVRQGFRTITPYLIVEEGPKLIDFLKHTFGAQDVGRFDASSGFHAEMRIGDSMLMLWSGPGLKGKEKVGAFHVYVDDCDAAYRRALETGAQSVIEPSDRPYGERLGEVKDLCGNNWYIATRLPGAQVMEGAGTLNPYVHPPKVRAYIEFLKAAFGAVELGVFEQGGRVMHAAVRIGDSVLEMGESGLPPELGRFFLYVDNCDAWYQRAIAAGAKSVQPPADQFHHHRTAVVADPMGQEWVPATLIP